MARPGPAIDEERLPWLEPYRDIVAHKQRVARRSHGGLVALAAAMAVLFAAAGGFWLGRRDIAPPPAVEIAVAPTVQAPIAPPVAAAIEPIVETPPPVAEAAPAPKPRKFVAAKVKKPIRRTARQRKIHSAGVETARLREVRAAQERAAASRPVAARAWSKMPSPGPAGQVIQLGAFKDPSGAIRAYRNRLARYPLLARMPRVVVPVITRPRGRVLYVLRLGTTSRQQSAIVCKNLRASGDHCLVIG